MTFLVGIKDFFGGLTRGFGLFFTERNDYTLRATTPGISVRK